MQQLVKCAKFFIEKKIVEAKIIMIGSYPECTDSIKILKRAQSQAIDLDDESSHCLECQKKDSIIMQLNQTIKNLSEKVEVYKEGSDNFQILRKTFETISNNKACTENLQDSFEPSILDISYPLIKVRKCQLDYLNSIKKATMAIRTLIDILFDEDQLKGMNASKLKNLYPEKIEVITNYIMSKFKIEKPRIIKVITNKCLSK